MELKRVKLVAKYDARWNKMYMETTCLIHREIDNLKYYHDNKEEDAFKLQITLMFTYQQKSIMMDGRR